MLSAQAEQMVPGLEMLAAPTKPVKPEVAAPAPDEYPLAVGLAMPDGILTTVKVRELNGRDEEAISRKTTVGLALETILELGVVSIGGVPATRDMLSRMYAADRISCLVAISRVTWGDVALLPYKCEKCGSDGEVEFDLSSMEFVKVSPDEAWMNLDLKCGKVRAHLPAGDFHSMGMRGELDNVSKFRTALINTCVTAINDVDLFVLGGAEGLSIKVRKELGDVLSEVRAGYNLSGEEVPCPDCGEKIPGVLALGALFPL